MRGVGAPSSNASGSGSEIYERLPDSGSQGDELDQRLGSDECLAAGDSDMYSSLDRQNGGGQEHLVRPSQIKNKKKQGRTFFTLTFDSLEFKIRIHFSLLNFKMLLSGRRSTSSQAKLLQGRRIQK